MEYLIDVRTPEEFSDGHYEGAIHHELLLFEDDLLPEYPTDSVIYLYCKTGLRAEKAKKILQENKFINVVNIGGYDAQIDQKETT